MSDLYLMTGCSGGGKSTLLEALRAKGYSTVSEPGLRVIQGSGPTPWEDRPGFIDAVVSLARKDLENLAPIDRPVFFDRGLFDALSGLAALRKVPLAELMPDGFRYAEPVFFAPPWPEIFEQTTDRPHSFQTALEEAARLRRDLKIMDIETIELPKIPVAQRTEYVLRFIA
ncbi:MAG: AAA family ATPase [Pseudomonadota bacterium]